MSFLDTLGGLLAHFTDDIHPNASVMVPVKTATWGALLAEARDDVSAASQVVRDVIANVAQELPGAALTVVQFAAGDWQRLRAAHTESVTGVPSIPVAPSTPATTSATAVPAVVPDPEGPDHTPTVPAEPPAEPAAPLA